MSTQKRRIVNAHIQSVPVKAGIRRVNEQRTRNQKSLFRVALASERLLSFHSSELFISSLSHRKFFLERNQESPLVKKHKRGKVFRWYPTSCTRSFQPSIFIRNSFSAPFSSLSPFCNLYSCLIIHGDENNPIFPNLSTSESRIRCSFVLGALSAIAVFSGNCAINCTIVLYDTR